MAEIKLPRTFRIGLFEETSSILFKTHTTKAQAFIQKTSRKSSIVVLLLLLVSLSSNSLFVLAQDSFKSKKHVTAPAAGKVLVGEVQAAAGAQGNLLSWQTTYERNILGFNLYREENGNRVLVNQQIVPGSAFLVGADVELNEGHHYQIWDKSATGAAHYWVEALDVAGNSNWQGPFETGQNQSGATISAVSHQQNLSVTSETGNGAYPVEPRAKLPNPVPLSSKGQTNISADACWKFDVKREGWYVITQPELVAAGFDAKTNPRFLQLYIDDQQQPIIVKGQEDGKFDPTDTIEFYGQGIDSAFSASRKYWLVKGHGPGLRLTSRAAATAPTAGGSFPYSLERKDRTIYFSSLLNGEKENFFGSVIFRNPLPQTFNIQHLDSSATQNAILKVKAQGVTLLTHILDVAINNNYAGQLVFEWQESGEANLSFPQSFLQEGDNTVTLTPRGGNSDVMLADSLVLTYQHTYSADNNYLRVSAGGGQLVTIWGFSNDLIEVYDVTNPLLVQPLKGQYLRRTVGDGVEFAVSFVSPDKGERQIIALTRDQIRSVANLNSDTPSTLRNANQGADLVIITGKEYFDALTPLVNLRQRQGLSVNVVNIEDIYDEFCFGQKTPQAVKSFLNFASSNWKRPVRYAMFFGDSSYDPKEYMGFGNNDVVPTKLVDTLFMETASDDWLADFNEDGIADLAIGRLPAHTLSEANTMVAKLLAYDNAKPSMEALLVSDIPDVYDFEAANQSLVPFLPKGTNVTFVKRSQMSDGDARNAILTNLNQGAKIVNYSGHGSVNLWRGNLLTSTDAGALQNSRNYPLFVMMNCLNGYYQDPLLEGLAESLLKAQQGGAVAAWASSALTFANEQDQINQEFYRLLFGNQRQMPTIGEAAIRAKAITTDPDIRRSWILFGDPSMHLK